MLTRLAQLSGRDWLRLDDSMRSPYRWSPLDNVTGWPSPWDRVCADLAAISDPDPDLARTGRADLLSWLQRDAATAYGRPSADQAAQIAARLATSTLTSEQRREVAFVAGIRPEPAV